VVLLSSAGLTRYPKGDALSVSPKAAAEQLMRAIAREEGRHGVRANAVRVGVVEAGIFERLRGDVIDAQWEAVAKRRIALGRFAAAEEIAAAVVFLASNQARYITGQALGVDGGYGV
jgi:NAD(P)-dependent dehydrogenase (short-subunit alcohol dehydrogenase family)